MMPKKSCPDNDGLMHDSAYARFNLFPATFMVWLHSVRARWELWCGSPTCWCQAVPDWTSFSEGLKMRANPWKKHLMKPPLFDMSMVWSFWYWWWYTMMHVHICDVWRHQHHPILVSPGISDKRNTPMNNERLFKGLGCTLLQDIICGITFLKYFCGSCSCGFLRLENWPGSRNQRWCKMTFRGVGVSARWKQPAVTGGEAEREWQSHLTFLMAWKPGQKFLRLSLPRIADSKNDYKKKRSWSGLPQFLRTINVLIGVPPSLPSDWWQERYLHISVAQRHNFPRASFLCYLCPWPDEIRVPEMFDQRMMPTTISTGSLISEGMMRIYESLRKRGKRHLT